MFSIYLFIIANVLNVCLSAPFSYFDLSHTIDPNIPYFPSQTRFNFTQQFAQWIGNEKPFFYSTNAFVTGEHMGTHLDSPYHFWTDGWKVDEIPLKNLVSVPARIIDVSKKCQKNRNYRITVDDVKKADLIIPDVDDDTGAQFVFVLIFYTGWTKYWPDQLSYAGGESDVEFPGLSEQLATYLVETYADSLVGVGIDTLSTDYGLSKDYPVHQVLAKKNVYGLENLALFDVLIKNAENYFFRLDVFPMKIGNGTGAPCRVIARLDNSRNNTNWFGLLLFFFFLFLIGFSVKVAYDLKYNPNKNF